MQWAQSLHQVVTTIPIGVAPRTAGWLRWFILGSITLIAVLAWVCLRGYASKGRHEDN